MSTEILLPKINPDRNYWFVRTEGGDYFDEFLNRGFISVNWNKISVEDIKKRSLSGDNFKNKIAKEYGFNSNSSKGKSSITSIANKLIHFAEDLKKGDFIVIPSVGSSRLAFGEIVDGHVYVENDPKGSCDHVKRKKVKWLEVKHISELGNIFYIITKSRHAISSLNKYSQHLDKVTNTLFQKGDEGHFVINVNTREELSYDTLFGTWGVLIDLAEEFAKSEGLEFDKKNIKAKINVQSPGDVELIVDGVVTIFIVAMIFGAVTGIDFNVESEYIKTKAKIPGFLERLSSFKNNVQKRKTVQQLTDNLNEMQTDSKDVIEAMKEIK